MAKRILVPRDLDDKARDLWHDTLGHLKSRRSPAFIPELDLPWLEQYSRHHMQARHALKRILGREEVEPESGWITLGAQRQKVQHPDVKTMHEALKHANDAARELLLPAKLRKQFEIEGNADDKDDPFSAP